ncbi:rRNA pseudouridine synthase [Candidatus Woesebacteria bacterium]|nr:rRNA pseudouridine synthase [Candidatus Woesebacteria bacterium]
MAHAGVASRRKCEELIATGKVKVNGEVAHVGQRIDPNTDIIRVEGKRVGSSENPRYFLVYKPRGYVSTTSDDMGRKTVVTLLPAIKERLYPVGRLDQDSEGLMILTNDGAFAHTMTHPSFKVPKTYEATVSGRPTYKALNLLKEGVKLTEGFTRPDHFTVIEEREHDTIIEMTIHQGYNRQVRRMFERIGYDVIKLVRKSLGKFTLADLGENKYRELDISEIKNN